MTSSLILAGRAALISSLLLRLFVYVFLRWVLYPAWLLWAIPFAVYLVSWLYVDRTLVDLEASPARTMDRQRQLPASTLQHNNHLADTTKLTYAGAVKETSPPASATTSSRDPAPSNALTTVDPPIEADPRARDVPHRPSWSSYLTGSLTSSRVTNRISLLVNLLLFAMAADNFAGLSFYPWYAAEGLQFARVGAVGPTWARISARVVDPSGRRVIYRATRPLGSWNVGPLIATTNETDFMGVVQLNHLDPSSQYEFRLTRPDQTTTVDPAYASAIRFKTFPDPRLAQSSHFTFASTSCLKPGYPYVPLKSKLAIDGAEHLTKTIRERSLDFVLFLGDFIYSDRPYYPGTKLSAYWRQYRQNYASPQWQQLMAAAPTLHVYDDHEFFNDFSGLGNDTTPKLAQGLTAYHHYNGAANHPGYHAGMNYYSFRHGDVGFFALDTRRYRSANGAPDDEHKTMLGETQKRDFLQWLHQVNQTLTFKFVISSVRRLLQFCDTETEDEQVPMMRLWEGPDRYMSSDTWSSFQHERRQLLDVMQYVPNVIVISGDRHEAAAASLRQTVLEFSVSPLSQFYVPLHTLSNSTADGEDVQLMYESRGSSKFATYEVDTRVANEPKCHVRVIIDGVEAWKVTVLGQPVKATHAQLGGLIPSLLELLGFRRRTWY